MYRINKDLHDSAVLIDPATGLPYTAGNGLPTSGLINGTDDGGVTLRPVKTNSAGNLEVIETNSINETIWVDSATPPKYFIRTQKWNTVTQIFDTILTLPNGTVYVPVGAIFPASSGSDKEVVTTHYQVITAGTGYSVGDLVNGIVVYDTNLGSVASEIYYNLTTSTVITPAIAELREVYQEYTPIVSTTSTTIKSYKHKAILAIDTASATLLTTDSVYGATSISVTNNSGSNLEIICDSLSIFAIAGDSFTMPVRLGKNKAITIVPRDSGLTATDVVALRIS